jgi:CRP/FNR family transcriptional regulator
MPYPGIIFIFAYMDWLKETFEADLLEEIQENQIQKIEADTILLTEGGFVNQIPLLMDGSVRVRKKDESGKEIILYHIHPGESCVLSITSCLTLKKSKAEAIVENHSDIILVPADKVREWQDKYKSWRSFVQKLYYQRLDVLLELVDAISFHQVDKRLVDKLKELQLIHGNSIPITHQQLANEIGSAREVVSRLLKQLEIGGSVRLERGIINLLKSI